MVLRCVGLGPQRERKEDKGAPWTAWYLHQTYCSRIGHYKGQFLNSGPGSGRLGEYAKVLVKGQPWVISHRGYCQRFVLTPETKNSRSNILEFKGYLKDTQSGSDSPSFFVLRVSESKVCLDLFLDRHRHRLFWVWSGHRLGLGKKTGFF